MSLQEQFRVAQDRVTKLPEKPDNMALLRLYALFKQGNEGDVTGKKPGMMDFIKRAKFEAWEALKGKSRDEAMQEYIKLVEELERNAS